MKNVEDFAGVIFDMDGVIIQSEPHWHRIEADFLGKLIPTWNKADQDDLLGMSMPDAIKKLRNEYGLKMEDEEYFDYYRALAQDLYGRDAEATTGVLLLIEKLHKNKIILAVASSSPMEWINFTLNRFQIRDYFKTVVSSDSVNGAGKPRPDIYLKVIKELGLELNVICAIEDSPNGIKSAKAAGLYCFGLYNGFNTKAQLAGCDYILDGF